jgi:hypothetical protein
MGKSDREQTMWEPFWEAKPIRAILKAFADYPRNLAQAKIASGLLRRFYEQARPLEELYQQLPGIYRGETRAISRFLGILDDTVQRRQLSSDLPRPGRSRPRPDANLKCPDSPLVPRARSLQLFEGVHHLTGHDKEQYGTYVNAILHLWTGVRCPDYFTLWAQRDFRDGGNRFQHEIDRAARLNDYEQRLGELDQLGRQLGSGESFTYPHPDDGGPSGWPPPGPGWPEPPRGCGPDDGPVPVPPGDEPCDFIHRLCEDLIRGGLHDFVIPPDAISNVGIESISPEAACAGDELVIHGSGFGDTPGDRVVVFGTEEADIVSWSDTKIVVRVPPGTGEVCISFRNTRREADRRDAYERNREATAQRNEGLHCLGLPGQRIVTPYVPQAARCNGKNGFKGVAPIIRRFTINGYTGGITVEVGTPLIARWEVDNADIVSITRVGSSGPPAAIAGPFSGEVNLGRFNGTQPVTATYRIQAINACTTVTADVVVNLTSTPNLVSRGLEVTQTIQQYTFGVPAEQHLVQLVANKLTMVRVYPVSGLNTGFDYGQGANVLPDVTGYLTVTYPDGTSERIDTPINDGGVVHAQPQASLDRENLAHSLNFLLPTVKLSGSVQVEARLFVPGYEGDPYSGRTAWDSGASVLFVEQGGLWMVYTRIGDSVQGLRAPDRAAFYALLQGCRTRFPIREAGFEIHIPPNHRVLTTGEDLTTDAGWSNLLDRLDDIADDYDADDAIWCGIVPDGAYAGQTGLGTDGVVDWWADNHKRLLCIAASPMTFAHEVAHTLSIDHAGEAPGCSGTGVENVDTSIPTQTEDVGMDVADPRLIPAGTEEFMGYCRGIAEDKWPSIVVYNRLFSRF